MSWKKAEPTEQVIIDGVDHDLFACTVRITGFPEVFKRVHGLPRIDTYDDTDLIVICVIDSVTVSQSGCPVTVKTEPLENQVASQPSDPVIVKAEPVESQDIQPSSDPVNNLRDSVIINDFTYHYILRRGVVVRPIYMGPDTPEMFIGSGGRTACIIDNQLSMRYINGSKVPIPVLWSAHLMAVASYRNTTVFKVMNTNLIDYIFIGTGFRSHLTILRNDDVSISAENGTMYFRTGNRIRCTVDLNVGTIIGPPLIVTKAELM